MIALPQSLKSLSILGCPQVRTIDCLLLPRGLKKLELHYYEGWDEEGVIVNLSFLPENLKSLSLKTVTCKEWKFNPEIPLKSLSIWGCPFEGSDMEVREIGPIYYPQAIPRSVKNLSFKNLRNIKNIHLTNLPPDLRVFRVRG